MFVPQESCSVHPFLSLITLFPVWLGPGRDQVYSQAHNIQSRGHLGVSVGPAAPAPRVGPLDVLAGVTPSQGTSLEQPHDLAVTSQRESSLIVCQRVIRVSHLTMKMYYCYVKSCQHSDRCVKACQPSPQVTCFHFISDIQLFCFGFFLKYRSIFYYKIPFTATIWMNFRNITL